jgi:hypothetical protein
MRLIGDQPSGYMLLPDVRRSAGMGGPDPLIVNLRGLRDDLEMLGNHLQSWLLRKTDEGRVALEVMARLQVPSTECRSPELDIQHNT